LNANLQIHRKRLREAIERRSRLVAEREARAEIEWDETILKTLSGKQEESIMQGLRNQIKDVAAFIKTRERTALNYLIKPLLDQFNRAFREE